MTRFFSLLFIFLGFAQQASSQSNARAGSEKKVRLSPLPVIYYSPETKLGFGALLAANFKLGSDSITRGSYLQNSFIYTTNKQYQFSSKGRIYGRDNRHISEFNVLFSFFPEFFYGYQTETPELFEELIEYNQLQLQARRFWRLRGSSYVGLLARYNRIYNLKSPVGGTFESVQPPGYLGYHVLGISPAFNYDSRDSQVYPTMGHYLEVLWLSYPGGLSDFVFGNFRLDARMYRSPGKLKEDVIATHFFMNLNQGSVPYKEMAEIGGSDIMRGYYTGYFRYKNLIATQAEYRFMVGRVIGFTGWIGVSTTSETWSKPFEHSLRPNGGVGLRVRINQHDRLSVRADYGFGRNQSGFYLNIAEAF